MGIYRLVTDCGGPLISLYLRHRLRQGREDPVRFNERLGLAQKPRPDGKVVWCHAASVGEAVSVLRLLTDLQKKYPAWHVLLTTGTVTSARLMATRLPPGIDHQYMPVDRRVYVRRFLDHWRPDLALWVESELWPNMLDMVRARHIPCLLLNARLSDRSFGRWRLMKRMALSLLSAFQGILAQSPEDAARFAQLGASTVLCFGNLKYAADPLPVDPCALDALRQAVGTRPVWVMASTHEGEESLAQAAHDAVRRAFPDLLTIIIPRHPHRGAAIRAMLEQTGRCVAQRSLREPITSQTDFYVADTLGEMGVFFALSRIVCVAGSFTWTGHNVLEPALFGCAIVIGPRMESFQKIAANMQTARACVQVSDAKELARQVEAWLRHPSEAAQIGEKARTFARDQQAVLTETVAFLDPYFYASS